MQILAVEEDGNLLGVLPLALRRGRMRDACLRVLGFSGETQSDRNDLIASPSDAGRVLEALNEPFLSSQSQADLVLLNNIPGGSPLRPWLNSQSGQRKWESTSLPYLNLLGSYEELEKTWRKSHRGDVRRQTRRLKELGELKLRKIEDEKEGAHWLDEFFTVHGARWRMKGHGQSSQTKQARKFYERLIDLMWAEGALHLSNLELDQKPISYHFGFLWRGRLHFYKPTFRPEYAGYSPGKVHVAFLLQEGFRQGWEVFDFLLGEEAYKYKWGSEKDTSHTLVQKGNTFLAGAGMWYFNEGMPMLRSIRQKIAGGASNVG